MNESTITEEKILQAARLEFERKGYNGTRMQVIADVAGISKASLHYHFRSKDNLFQRIFDDALNAYIPLVNTWKDDSLNWEEKVNRFTTDLLEFVQKGTMLFIIREINRNPELLSERLKKSKSPNSFILYFEQLNTDNQIRQTDPRLLYIFLQSICCFPAINNQMFKKVLRLTDKQYHEMMEGYARAAATFIINAIKK
ncbi:MAG: TetR/AcrR family transcriptional regulator [Sphingobacteriia bacterium]|nr:TetR/AcrR family transcriptional regulator [Sphingobacteriia bacterium]